MLITLCTILAVRLVMIVCTFVGVRTKFFVRRWQIRRGIITVEQSNSNVHESDESSGTNIRQNRNDLDKNRGAANSLEIRELVFNSFNSF